MLNRIRLKRKTSNPGVSDHHVIVGTETERDYKGHSSYDYDVTSIVVSKREQYNLFVAFVAAMLSTGSRLESIDFDVVSHAVQRTAERAGMDGLADVTISERMKPGDHKGAGYPSARHEFASSVAVNRGAGRSGFLGR